MFSQLMPALRMLVVLTVLTGLVYPLLVTGVARLAFPHQASGSLIVVGDKTVGIGIARSAFRRSQILLEPAVGDVATTVQRRGVFGLESGRAQSRPG